jgi:dTDP-4-amino-4,6-dideoxygalactose transaminase
MLMARAARFARYAYAVPWCVPQWSWRELGASLAGSLSPGAGSADAFAAEACALLATRFAVPVGLGRMAIELGLRSLGVGPADEVVLPSYVCESVLQAVRHVGAQPVFADVGTDLNVTPATVVAALTPRTRCVIVPHLFGVPVPIGAIERALRDRGIPLMDDAAQALGATVEGRPVGSFGACGILSCGPGKPLAGSGGGLLVTNDQTLFERAAAMVPSLAEAAGGRRRVWSFWLWRRHRRFSLPLRVMAGRFIDLPDRREEGDYLMAHMAEIEARVCLAQLRRLQETTERRRANAAAMLAALGPLARYNVVDTGPGTAAMKLALVLPEGGPSPEDAIEAFADGGVECQPGYVPCHHGVEGARGSVPYTEATWERVVCIPLERRLRDTARLAAALSRLPAPRSAAGAAAVPIGGRA